MNKSELIAAVAQSQDIPKTNAAKLVEATLDAMAAGIVEGGLELQGFGNFAIKHREARTGRNPRTGEALEIAAKNVVDFSPSSKLKAAVNPTTSA
jgi:DNA-binding protein HU-beta